MTTYGNNNLDLGEILCPTELTATAGKPSIGA